MKKTIHFKNVACKLIGTLVISSFALTTFASDYSSHWAKLPIEKWKEAGVIGGYQDGTFKPNHPVTRAELAKMVAQVLGLTDTKGAKTYDDVKTANWYAEDVAKISALGLMNDSGSKFRPNDHATREEAAYLIASAYQLTASSQEVDFKDLNQVSPWAKDKVIALRQNKLIGGKANNRFDPKGKLTRAEVAAMLDNSAPNYIIAAGTYSAVKPGNVVIRTKDTVLKDVTVTGNLYLTAGIGQGDVTIENVIVKGNTYIAGGGLNSITFKNSTLEKEAIVSATHPVRIVSQGSTFSLKTAAHAAAHLAGSFDEVTLAAGSKAELKGAAVKQMTISEGTGTKLTSITLDERSEVIQAVAKSAASITGKGKIKALDIQSQGVIIEQKPEAVQIKEGITATIAGQKMDSTNSTKLPAAGGGGGGGGGGEAPASLLQGVNGKIQLGSSEVNAQVVNGKIIFDLRGVSDKERLSGLTINADSNLNINLSELSTSLTTNRDYSITGMIANTSTSEIKDKIGSGHSDAEINLAKAFIGMQSDISVGKAKDLAKMVGDYSYTGTISDGKGNSETITIEIILN